MTMNKLPPLNKTQKIRFERAMERLKSLSSKASNSVIVTTDSIPVNHDDAFLKGHGTREVNGELLATVCGAVVHVDKLVYVRTLRAKYKPEVGDTVVGRVIEVCQSFWRVEVNSSQDGLLKLASTNMPDFIQKISSSVDELNMRNFFVEDDVVCAKVGSIHSDGGLKLQTAQSHKYGKLEKGQLLEVDPYLVKRTNHHFHYIESLGVDLILGSNGFIWVGEHVQVQDSMTVDTKKEQSHTPLETPLSIVRIANAIRVLSNLGFTMTLEVIMGTVNLSNTVNIEVHDMLGSEFHVLVAENEAGTRIRRA